MPTSQRPARLTTCAVLAVALNAGALGIAASASSAWQDFAVSTSNDRPPKTLTLVTAQDEPAVATGFDDVALDAATSNAPAPKAIKLPVASTTRAPQPSPLVQPVVFYTFREVDNPAFPESDWNLDAESLDEIGVQQLTFEVLINDRGDVVGCTVLAPADLTEDVKRGLERRLSETRLLPAERAGQFVASVRRIELAVAAAPLDALFAPAARRP